MSEDQSQVDGHPADAVYERYNLAIICIIPKILKMLLNYFCAVFYYVKQEVNISLPSKSHFQIEF